MFLHGVPQPSRVEDRTKNKLASATEFLYISNPSLYLYVGSYSASIPSWLRGDTTLTAKACRVSSNRSLTPACRSKRMFRRSSARSRDGRAHMLTHITTTLKADKHSGRPSIGHCDATSDSPWPQGAETSSRSSRLCHFVREISAVCQGSLPGGETIVYQQIAGSG